MCFKQPIQCFIKYDIRGKYIDYKKSIFATIFALFIVLTIVFVILYSRCFTSYTNVVNSKGKYKWCNKVKQHLHPAYSMFCQRCLTIAHPYPFVRDQLLSFHKFHCYSLYIGRLYGKVISYVNGKIWGTLTKGQRQNIDP